MNRAWVAACAVAEAVGMTAAAGAAGSATALVDHGSTRAATIGLILILLGGLVEGTVLGWLQARALDDLLGSVGRRQWVLVTILVAGLGWAAASAPAALSGNDGSAQPALPVALSGAVALGLVMGATLGVAQAWALRHRVRHPWRWIVGSATGWAAAMPVIYFGAGAAGATWPWWLVVPVGTVTGLVAGAVLGAVSGPFLESLESPTWHRRGSRDPAHSLGRS